MVNGLHDDDDFEVCMEGHARPPSHRRRRSLPPPAADHGAMRAPPAPHGTADHVAILMASRRPEKVLEVFAVGMQVAMETAMVVAMLLSFLQEMEMMLAAAPLPDRNP